MKVSCGGWLQNPAALDKWFIPLLMGFHPFAGAGLRNHPSWYKNG